MERGGRERKEKKMGKEEGKKGRGIGGWLPVRRD
jgi:hypothetical protein